MKQKKPGKLLSLLLAAVMVLSILPATVFAADTPTDKGIMMGTAGISDQTVCTLPNHNTIFVPSDYIWFGVYSNRDLLPLKWRVLDADQTSSGKPGMLLLTEHVITNLKFDTDPPRTEGQNLWEGSNAQDWCKSFAGVISGDPWSQGVTTEELAAVMSTDIADSEFILKLAKENVETWDKFTFSPTVSPANRFFSLSAEELVRYMIADTDNIVMDQSISATDRNGKAASWWLRSPINIASYTQWAGYISNAGEICNQGDVHLRQYIRPACNLDLDKVLFASAAEGGKPEPLGLSLIPDYSGNEWKLTLADSSRGFAVTNSKQVGRTFTVTYTGAKTGKDEYISAILTDQAGQALYYGRLKAADAASGSVVVTLPDTLVSGSYQLKIFNEQCNGDKKTDYASAFSNISVVAFEAPKPQFLKAGGTFEGDVVVELGIDDPLSKAEIRYTTDGTTPSETNGQLYTGPITLRVTDAEETTYVIRAISVEEGKKPSDVVEETFILKPQTLTDVSLDLGSLSQAPGLETCYNEYNEALLPDTSRPFQVDELRWYKDDVLEYQYLPATDETWEIEADAGFDGSDNTHTYTLEADISARAGYRIDHLKTSPFVSDVDAAWKENVSENVLCITYYPLTIYQGEYVISDQLAAEQTPITVEEDRNYRPADMEFFGWDTNIYDLRPGDKQILKFDMPPQAVEVRAVYDVPRSNFCTILGTDSTGVQVKLHRATDKFVLYAAGYDQDGRMIALGKHEVEDYDAGQTVTVRGKGFEQADTVKAFLITFTHAPVYGAICRP